MKYSLAAFLAALLCTSFTLRHYYIGDDLRLNQIQVIASHNSYHLRTDKAVLRFLKNLYGMGLLPRDLNPKEIDYTNVSLTEQFEKYGVRGIELDIYNDPEGGRFDDRRGRAWVWKRSHTHIPEMKQPGFKILHIPDFDYNTTNPTFRSALAEIKKWSDAHPGHLPLFINVETKADAPGDKIHQLHKLAHSAPFDSIAAETMDAEVRSIFGQNLNGVITPDMVRGSYQSLEQSVLDGHWPTLGEARGKIIFIIDAGDGIVSIYKKGHASFRDRVMFAYTNPGTPEAAFVIHNGAESDYQNIQKHVKMGYIVRTRCDEGTHQAREGNYSTMHTAMCSGAQILSTDYYKPDARAGSKGWSNYQVKFPEGELVRVDSISAQGKNHIPPLHE